MAKLLILQLVEAQAIAAGPMYTAPALTVALIQAATLYNPTGAPVACQVAITASGAAIAPGNTLLNLPLAAGKTYLCPELIGQRVSDGHQLKATGAGVTIAVGGTEVSEQV